MKNAIIVHGTCSRKEYFSDEKPTLSNQNWIPWLQKQLMMRDVIAYAPDMPYAFKPDYERWRLEAERYSIGPQTMLVGHSTGGGFWVRWLSEHPDVHVGKVVLVAPWLDPNNIKKTSFFDFEIDPTLVARTQGLTIFHSDNDHLGIHWSVDIFREKLIGHQYREFHNYGHFCYEEMQTHTFPELLDELLATDGVMISA
jgi:predicted alpha/beta hydrolase family esterase